MLIMMLASHTIIGTAAASLVTGNPMLSFGLALASHYLSDSIPHWEYKIISKSLHPNFCEKILWHDKKVCLDVLKLGTDFTLGIIISIVIFKFSLGVDWTTVTVGILGGVLPDIFLFGYSKCRKRPFIISERIHRFFHSKNDWSEKPVRGVAVQLALVLLVIFISIFY